MITLGIGELMTTAALSFHHFFGGEGGVNSNRVIGHSLFGFKYGPAIQVYYLILGWTVISALSDAVSDAHAARAHGERLARQFRARAVRRLRPAHGALPAIRAVRLLRRHRRRALCHHLRDRHLRRARGAPVGQCAADGLYRRLRRLRRTDPRRRADHAAAERRQPDVELLAGLCRRALHHHGDLRAARHHGPDRGAWPDPRRRALLAVAGALCCG